MFLLCLLQVSVGFAKKIVQEKEEQEMHCNWGLGT